MKCAIVIPSRLDSSRLPQKALRKICGIPLIEHVYKRALLSQVADKVFVATDSPLIAEVIHNCNGNVLMTSSAHRNGTERIAEAAININAEYILNVQGDEALVDPNHIISYSGRRPFITRRRRHVIRRRRLIHGGLSSA